MNQGEVNEAPTLVDALRALGVRGVLVDMAKAGQIIELRCEMPYCYCPHGRSYFAKKTTHPPPRWALSPDHYPTLKSDGGHLDPWNVRLSHILCNNLDFGWRTRIRTMLQKRMALEQIAEKLNQKRVPRPHGYTRWTVAVVRKAFVS
jgi:hypothetical protein